MTSAMRLGEVADVVSGVGFPKDLQGQSAGEVPVFKVGDISSAVKSGNRYLRTSPNHLSKEAARKLAANLMPAGTTVFAKIGEGLKLNRRAVLAQPSLVDNNVMGLVPKVGMATSAYLYYFMQTVDLGGLSQATAVPSVRKSDVVEISIPVPSIHRQSEIVAEIEKQFSRLDDAVANLQRVKANLKRYKAAVLGDAVGGELAGKTSSWRAAALGEIAASVRNGHSQKPDAERGTPILRISAVRPLELNTNDVRYLSGVPSDYEPFTLAANDVLFTRYNGSRDYVGVCAQVPTGMRPTVYPDKLIRVRLPADVLLPSFLVIAASTGGPRAFIESRIRTTAGQAGISGGDLKALPLRFPPLAEQLRIVAEVDRRLSIVREFEAEVDANLKRSQALRQAVLQAAFACKLPA